MIIWMREQNRGSDDGGRISFFGFDMQGPGNAVTCVVDLSGRLGPSDQAEVARLYEGTARFRHLSDEETARLRGQARRVMELLDAISHHRTLLGGMPNPFTAWLLTRSLETLKIRAEQQQANAQHIAEFLVRHPKVREVCYVGLLNPTDPEHEIYLKQHSGPGSLISFFPIDLRSPVIGAYRRGPGRGESELFGLPTYVATDVVARAIDKACANGQATRAEVRRFLAQTNIPKAQSLLGFAVRFVQTVRLPLGPGDMQRPADFGIYRVNPDGSYVRVA